MPARVVFVRSKSPAGIEPRLAKEATSLARAGYEVHAILWDRTRSFPPREIRDGIRIHRYHLQAPEGCGRGEFPGRDPLFPKHRAPVRKEFVG